MADPNPFTQDYRTYAEALRAENESKLAAFRQGLSLELGQLRGVSVAITGSHARLEAGLGSNIETILIKDRADNAAATRPLSLLSGLQRTPAGDENCAEDLIEVKNIDTDDMYRFNNERRKNFPGRLLYAAPLHGDQTTFAAARDKLFSELRGTAGKDVLHSLKNRVRDFREVIKTGKQKFNQETTLQHFDLNEGIAYYDPAQKLLGLKAGPLRYTQVRTLRESLGAARTTDEATARRILLDSPASIPLRLEFLSEQGVLPFTEQQRKTVEDTYFFALAAYHQSQIRYWQIGERKTLFDAREVRERLSDLCSIFGYELVVPQK
ncbi:hypothetical protein C4580_03080 [Candidatus Woesearchaeota archaeon]|nr:MAG: hypothetical protein C4580_03080 [Candidatus Woesearchaeota archaeon]